MSGITVLTLKLIALCSMIIDHVGFFLYPRFAPYPVVRILRAIGRLAFPLYAFLIVNGFDRTRDVKRYLTRLCRFAVISQIPFVLAFDFGVAVEPGPAFALTGPWPAGELVLIAFVALVWLMTVRRDASVLWPVLALALAVIRVRVSYVTLLWEDMNVFYTLALGLACVSILDRALKPRRDIRLLLLQAGALTSAFLIIRGTADYRYLGVALIIALSLCRDRRPSQALLIVMWASVEYLLGLMRLDYFLFGAAAALPVLLYSGRQGRPLKPFFYWIYPVHLLTLGLLNLWLSLHI